MCMIRVYESVHTLSFCGSQFPLDPLCRPPHPPSAALCEGLQQAPAKCTDVHGSIWAVLPNKTTKKALAPATSIRSRAEP